MTMRATPRLISRTAVALVLLAMGVVFQNRLVELREDASPYRPEELQGAPPGVAFTTVALGSVRGIVADILWLRSFDLQLDGRYFELMQLSRWITALSGSDAAPWIHQGWNLAYNVPPILASPEDQWRWVDAGIALMREEGVPRAGGPELYGELSFFYADKLAGQVDQSAPYFGARFATGIAPLLQPDGRLPPTGDPRLERLAKTYRLFPSIATEMEARYACNFDWRNPLSHAAYWAYRGRLAAPPGSPSRQCDRLLYQALSALFRRGRNRPTPSQPVHVDPRFYKAATGAFGDAIANHPEDNFMPVTHAYFLRAAIAQLLGCGEEALARDAYNELMTKYPDTKATQSLTSPPIPALKDTP